MKKLLIPILSVLIVVAGAGGYFVGKSAAKKEILAAEETYRKSADGAKEVAIKYLNALKFSDIPEAYSYICPEFQNKVTEEKFVSRWEKIDKELTNEGTVIQDFPVTDVIVNDDLAKIRFSQVFYNPVTKEFSKPSQAEFQLISGQWCAMPPTDGY